MKRLLVALLLGVAAPAAAFSLIDWTVFGPATPLVYFEARGPAGSLAVLSGYNGVATAAVNTVIQQSMYQRIKPVRIGMNATSPGTGAGSYTVEAYDVTAAASMCISTALPCNGSTNTSVDCFATGTATAVAQSNVLLRLNGTGCTTVPLGNVSLEYQTVIADEGVDFSPRFLPYGALGLDGGGTFFGLDSYQFDTITCQWDQAGVVSGGTDIMRLQLIQKSDAGVMCTCDLPGACNDAPNIEHTCNCGAVKYLIDTNGLKSGYAIQLNSSTNCVYNPQGIACAIPFRR